MSQHLSVQRAHPSELQLPHLYSEVGRGHLLAIFFVSYVLDFLSQEAEGQGGPKAQTPEQGRTVVNPDQ